MNQICEIVSAINDAGINIKWIEWDGAELSLDTTDPEKTKTILMEFASAQKISETKLTDIQRFEDFAIVTFGLPQLWLEE